MKILEITEFSAGVCGVFTRVLSESKEFVKKGHEVTIFSSDIEKGTNKKTKILNEEIDGVKIKRFKSNAGLIDKMISGNVTYFNFKKELIDEKPDLVITHLIHPHSIKAVEICNKNRIPCYLVTHSPFNVNRRFPLNIATSFYYLAKVRPVINKFDKVIAITRWEMPFLDKLGVNKNKIVYIPNGLPQEYFKQKKEKPNKDVLFLGRIAPVKDITTLIRAAKLAPEINFSIVGPVEEGYLKVLRPLLNGATNVKIMPPVFDLNKKIKLIDAHKVFVLPSIREAMPQVLLEAMSRGKIVISSDTDGGKEIIDNGRTGFIFKIGDYLELANKIKENLPGNKNVSANAVKKAKEFSWEELIKRYTSLFK